MKYIKIVKHTFLEINPNRECFTYMSWIALKWMQKKKKYFQTAVEVSTILGKKVGDTISLGWESELKEGATTQVL
jgi:hypothetical protein